MYQFFVCPISLVFFIIVDWHEIISLSVLIFKSAEKKPECSFNGFSNQWHKIHFVTVLSQTYAKMQLIYRFK